MRARIELAGAEMLLGNDGRVMEVLEGDRSTDLGARSEYGNLEVALRMRQALRALRATPQRTGEALDRLEEALEVEPDNLSVVSWISDLGVALPEVRPRVRVILEKRASRPGAGWKVHFALGMQCLPNRDYAAALPHLETAHRMDPRNPILANNLAWCLANLEPPRVDRALELVDGVMKADAAIARDPAYRDTRGQILIKLGMKDLERAQTGLGDEERRGIDRLLQEAHEAMAKVMGDQESVEP